MDTYILLGIVVALSGAVIRRRLYPKPRHREHMKLNKITKVIQAIQEEETRQGKVDLIKSNLNPSLVGLLRMAFDETLELDVDLDVRYRPLKENDWLESFSRSAKGWHVFLKTSHHPRAKKNARLVAMLEKLEPREAELFLKAARRELDLGIPASALKACFPEIFKSKE